MSESLQRGDLAYVDVYASPLIPIKILRVTSGRDRFGDPERVVFVRVTADRPGYVRGEVFRARPDTVVSRRTRVRRGSGHIMVTGVDLVADLSLTCGHCGGVAHRDRFGDYQVIHMGVPCDRVGPLTSADIRALDACLAAHRANGYVLA